jgi:hypothetical protein
VNPELKLGNKFFDNHHNRFAFLVIQRIRMRGAEPAFVVIEVSA